MGGWIALFGSVSDFDERLQKFKRVFEVKNVPNLVTQTNNFGNCFRSIFWAWGNEDVPDLTISSNASEILLLCGAVTDIGRFSQDNIGAANISDKILSLWNEHRESLIDQINGSWSLVFYDDKDKSMTLYADRFASRSIWISRDDKLWIIGNFPAAIVSIRKNTTNVDPAGLASLFYTSRHIPGRSLYKEVFPLSAGEKAVLRYDGRCSQSKWWKRMYRPIHGVHPREWGYRLAHVLRKSAERVKNITPHHYLFLSGGLDSRIAAASIGHPLKTITLCNLPNMQCIFAGLVAKAIGLKHRTIVRTPYWYLDNLEAASLISSGNHITAHTHFIAPVKEMGNHSKNIAFFLGDLLENLNKHYFDIPPQNSLGFDARSLPYFFRKFVPGTSKNPGRLSNIFNRKIRDQLNRCWIEALEQSVKSVSNVSDDCRDQADTYLRWVDASVTYSYNMITSIWPFARERNIFFDNELNDLSLKIPSQIRGKGVIHPWILWYLNELLVLIPDANYFLPVFASKNFKYIGKRIRAKVDSVRHTIYSQVNEGPVNQTSGSWPLRHELYRKDSNYCNKIETILKDKHAFPHEIFNESAIQNIWREFLNGNNDLLFEIDVMISFGSLNQLIPSSGMIW